VPKAGPGVGSGSPRCAPPRLPRRPIHPVRRPRVAGQGSPTSQPCRAPQGVVVKSAGALRPASRRVLRGVKYVNAGRRRAGVMPAAPVPPHARVSLHRGYKGVPLVEGLGGRGRARVRVAAGAGLLPQLLPPGSPGKGAGRGGRNQDEGEGGADVKRRPDLIPPRLHAPREASNRDNSSKSHQQTNSTYAGP
jgi:hypothetical protein